MAPPFKTAEFDIMYGEGISKEGDVLDCAVESKLIDKAGSWYSYKGDRLGQGRENVKLYFKENPELLKELYAKLIDDLKNQDSKSENIKEAEPDRRQIGRASCRERV